MGSGSPNMNVIMRLVAQDPGFKSQIEAADPNIQRAVHSMAGLPPPSRGAQREQIMGKGSADNLFLREQERRKKERRSVNPLMADPQRFGVSVPPVQQVDQITVQSYPASRPGKGSSEYVSPFSGFGEMLREEGRNKGGRRERVNPLLADPQRFGIPMESIAPILSVPIPTNPLGNRIVPPPTEAQAQADYDYTLNTLKTEPVYPGASFANVLPEGYNTLENIAENQGMSPFDQSQRSTITGTTTGPLSQTTANPGNFGGSILNKLNELNTGNT